MSEIDPLGLHTPLIEQIRASVDDLGTLSSIRHEAPVLNAKAQNETAVRFLGLAACGELEIEKIRWTEHEVAAELRSFTILAWGKVIHVGEDETAGEFDGWYIAEELHGGNPFLLLEPSRVFRHERNLSGEEELLLRFLQRE